MKFRNNWKALSKQKDKFMVRLRVSSIDFISIEIDISRDFYAFTVLNFTIKNR